LCPLDLCAQLMDSSRCRILCEFAWYMRSTCLFRSSFVTFVLVLGVACSTKTARKDIMITTMIIITVLIHHGMGCTRSCVFHASPRLSESKSRVVPSRQRPVVPCAVSRLTRHDTNVPRHLCGFQSYADRYSLILASI
jgi:hypothetical protein